MRRLAWLSIAYLSFMLGLVGAFLPVLPTTPFMLVAVWAGSKGSHRFKWWLLRHPKFGPSLRLWYRHGAISTRNKRLAVTVIIISWILLWWRGSGVTVLLITALILGSSSVFLLSRPSEIRANAD